MYRERFASTPHTPSFYKAAFWGFVLFIFAKTIILNKCRPFFFFLRLCSAPAQGKAEGRGGGRVWRGGRAASGFHLWVVSSLLAPSAGPQVGSLGGGGMSGVGRQQVTVGQDECSPQQSEETVPAVAPMGLRAWGQTQGVVG